jgi:hypothetical protein
MHDILEGSLQYELKLVLRKLISDKCLRLEELNNRLRSFAFGVDSKSKPQPISSEVLNSKSKKLGMNASQAWCFGRYFCLLVADLVDDSYTYLHLIHSLLDIMDVIFAPVVTVSMTYRLEELISQHHQLFRSLFPAERLIPKQHFLIHYPSKIRNLGPPVQYWCMRFESKHASAKDFCRLIHNFKNICMSIAWQQQIRLCVDWLTPEHLVSEVGPGKMLLPCSLPVPDNVFKGTNIALYEEVYTANYVEVNGSRYKIGNVLVLNVVADSPVFGQILFIVCAGNKVIFLVQTLQTDHYCDRVHGFEVHLTDEILGINYKDLYDWHPLSIYEGYGSIRNSRYIIPRYEWLC